MLRYKTEVAWFSRLVRHPARKWSGSILTTPKPAWGEGLKVKVTTGAKRAKLQSNGPSGTGPFSSGHVVNS